jgi:uncharacterized protein (TIGR02996 family)
VTPCDEAAFLRAIIAAPDDDLARLAYADWLDDRADPDRRDTARAELIRTSIAVTVPGLTAGAINGHVERIDALLADPANRVWIPEGYGVSKFTELRKIPGLAWDRGFVHTVTGFVPNFAVSLRRVRALAAAHPVSRIAITNDFQVPVTDGGGVTFRHALFVSDVDFRVSTRRTATVYGQPVLPKSLEMYLTGHLGALENVWPLGPRRVVGLRAVRYATAASARIDLGRALVEYAHAPVRNPRYKSNEPTLYDINGEVIT